jgi:hypothetical protein
MSEYEAEVEVEEPDPAPDSEPAPDPEPEPDPAPVAWAPPQEEWQQMSQVVQQLGQLLQEQEQPQAPEEIEFDPFDPESMQRFVQQQAQAIAEAQMAPFRGLLGMLSEREGEQLAKAELEKISGEVGQFDNDMAFLIASGMVDHGQDPAQALRHSASTVKDFESKIRADERAKVQAEFQGLGSAPGETPVGSGSAVPGQPVPTGPNRYEEAIARAMANRRPTMPVG